MGAALRIPRPPRGCRPSAVRECHPPPRPSEAERLPEVLANEAKAGRLLLLLDGLDEVRGTELDDTLALLGELDSRWPKTPMVVTSRPIGCPAPMDSQFLPVGLLPFDRDRRLRFLERLFGRAETTRPGAAAALAESIESDHQLRDLAGNPLYLTFLALLHQQGVRLDQNRSRLYDEVFELLLKGQHRSGSKPMPAHTRTLQALGYLGYGMTEDNVDHEPVEKLENRLR